MSMQFWIPGGPSQGGRIVLCSHRDGDRLRLVAAWEQWCPCWRQHGQEHSSAEWEKPRWNIDPCCLQSGSKGLEINHSSQQGKSSENRLLGGKFGTLRTDSLHTFDYVCRLMWRPTPCWNDALTSCYHCFSFILAWCCLLRSKRLVIRTYYMLLVE